TARRARGRDRCRGGFGRGPRGGGGRPLPARGGLGGTVRRCRGGWGGWDGRPTGRGPHRRPVGGGPYRARRVVGGGLWGRRGLFPRCGRRWGGYCPCRRGSRLPCWPSARLLRALWLWGCARRAVTCFRASDAHVRASRASTGLSRRSLRDGLPPNPPPPARA